VVLDEPIHPARQAGGPARPCLTGRQAGLQSKEKLFGSVYKSFVFVIELVR
jgi:hypothetical protein